MRDHQKGKLDWVVDAVRPMFQPLLWLDDLSLAGYESLARVQAGVGSQDTATMVAAARAAGLLPNLTAAMTRHSIEAVCEGDWSPNLTLFGNLDPDATATRPDMPTVRSMDLAVAAGIRIVAEITEHSLLVHPRALSRAIELVRSRGWGIAMDDVGVNDESLTLLPILRPDIVKLDMSLMHGPFDARATRTAATARTYCDHTGALMVCEGVETDRHEARARALGADLVQGFRYGHPAAQPASSYKIGRPVALLAANNAQPTILAEEPATYARAYLPANQIISLADEMLTTVTGHTSGAIVIVTAPAADSIEPAYLDALAAVAPYSALAAVIAPGLEPQPAPGVRGVDASALHTVGSPWSISTIGPTTARSILIDRLDGPTELVGHRLIHDQTTVAHILRELLAALVT